MEEVTVDFYPYLHLQNPDDKNIALIKLNTPFNGYGHVFTTLWKKAALRVLVDGAVNRLYSWSEKSREDYIPDMITGDFDSARSEVLDYYKKKNVEIIQTPDQMETDFTKSLRILSEKVSQENLPVSAVYTHVSFDGRFDHILANINTLYCARDILNVPVYLTSGGSTVFLLGKGQSRVHVGSRAVGCWCGLVPFSGPCEKVTTTGLKYNLDHQGMNFGGLISTSNTIANDVVTVDSDNFIVMSITESDATI